MQLARPHSIPEEGEKQQLLSLIHTTTCSWCFVQKSQALGFFVRTIKVPYDLLRVLALGKSELFEWGLVPFLWCSGGQIWKPGSLEFLCPQEGVPSATSWEVCGSPGPAQGTSPPTEHELVIANTNTTLGVLPSSHKYWKRAVKKMLLMLRSALFISVRQRFKQTRA